MKQGSIESLREKHAEATREHILGKAYELLVEHPEQPFSHEAVAKRAEVGARTVYRYFPSQADLYEGMWLLLRRHSGTIFPQTEEEILPQVPVLFGNFDRNEKVIRAVLESPMGHRVRERGIPEGRESFQKSLAGLTKGMSAAKQRQVIAVFLAVYSAPFWELLRNRGGLDGKDAIDAAEWTMSTLLEGLRKKARKSKTRRR
ncbi:TetR/AcrR family transcriptional regulator [Occallatibacter savannae]|uniref:TetR/AcrR family transcriptional regulator n=1 Tax=Occallatibacter savannae TaxID=1002691 RepID=UPI000D687F52|nr:TetR/AcrR family transcriptional regulator [Occallatibacter savannae]